MAKFKKALLISVASVLVAAMAIGGSYAYLMDNDSDVNVMTLGNVDIEQFEYQRVVENDAWVSLKDADEYGYTPDKMEEFTDNKPAYPAVYLDGSVKWDDRNGSQNPSGDGSHQQSWGQVGAPGSNQLFDDSVKNVIDKFVFVKNTGRSDAYYRTYIAIEWSHTLSEDLLHLNLNSNSRFTKSTVGYYTVDDVEYLVYEMLYNEILKPGEVSRPSLLQFFLDPLATNEVCALFGETWDVVVLSQAVQVAGFESAGSANYSSRAAVPASGIALDTAFGEPEDSADGQNANIQLWISGGYAAEIDTWDGTADTTWYNEAANEFILTSAEQVAGLSELVDNGNTFEGKTFKLAKDIDLSAKDENGDPICFEPIGSYRKNTPFKGTFDGQGHTIANMSQNTWALDNGYYYDDLGLGLFGKVEDATIKNLTMDGASISGESAICGAIVGCAYGDCTFENVTVKNSKVNDYQYYAGGVVGWASGNHTYKNINVDASTTIGGQWGDFGNANGGIIGGIGSSAVILFEDCTIACRIDAVNDVVSAYQWYNYRNSGMLIGRVPQTIKNGEVQTVKTPENVTCKNVTVIYDDWANYTYCEFAGTGYPYVRVQAGVSVDAYSNVRYGHPTDANGNTVVDDNHVHNDGEAHHELIAFDQLFGGPAEHRYCYYGISEFDGVTVIYNNK